jgi:crotonobetaine/carnitine-CoA ligase
VTSRPGVEQRHPAGKVNTSTGAPVDVFTAPAGSGAELPQTVIEMAARLGQLDPDAPALIFDDGVVVSRGELLEHSERFAGYLQGAIAPGEMVAVMMSNRTEYMIVWLATLAVGCVLVAVNPEAGEHDLAHVLSDSEAVIVVCDEASDERLARVAPQLEHLRERIVVSGKEPAGLDRWTGGQPLRFSELDANPEAVTNIYYTSGTTGPPKGCMAGNAYWRGLVMSYLGEYGIGPDDRVLCCLKFFYNDPSWLLLSSMHAGAPLVVMRRFSVSRFWDVVRANRVSQLFTIGSIPALLLSAAASPADRDHRVRFGVQVAVDAGLHREMTSRWGFPWVDIYGLTETGGLISVPLEHADEMTGSGSMGRPKVGIECRLVSDDGSEAPAGEAGELLVRGPGFMTGYLNRPDATAAAIDPEGWFHTGDNVRQDEHGWMYFVGRRKDIIRRAGENISASEVEDVLRSHPAVTDAAAVPVDDPLRGEELLAHIYLTTREDHETLARALTAHCEERLARHKVPRYLMFTHQDFVRTPSMRVAKAELRRGSVPAEAWDREQSG